MTTELSMSIFGLERLILKLDIYVATFIPLIKLIFFKILSIKGFFYKRLLFSV